MPSPPTGGRGGAGVSVGLVVGVVVGGGVLVGLYSVPKSTTSTGPLRSVVVPSPNCPSLWRPQPLSPPAVVTAQVCWPPAPTEAALVVRPETSTGVLLQGK